MRQWIAKIIIATIPIASIGAFPTNTCISTSDVNKITGGWDSFRWNWTGYEDQWCRIFTMSGSTFVDLTDLNVAFKVAKKTESGQVAYISLAPASVTVSGSNATFSIPYTNIPSDGRYLAELWCYTGTSTGAARSLAQGVIDTHNSLYQASDSSFPWPSNQDTFASYVPLSDANYIAAVTNADSGTGTTASKSGRVITYSHNDLSSQTNVVGSSGWVLQGVGLDTVGLGHVTNIDMVDLDSRYFTEAEIVSITGTLYTAAQSGWAASDVLATGQLYTAASLGWAASDLLATQALYVTAQSAWLLADVSATGNLYTVASLAWAAADTAATQALWVTVAGATQVVGAAAATADAKAVAASNHNAYADSAGTASYSTNAGTASALGVLSQNVQFSGHSSATMRGMEGATSSNALHASGAPTSGTVDPDNGASTVWYAIGNATYPGWIIDYLSTGASWMLIDNAIGNWGLYYSNQTFYARNMSTPGSLTVSGGINGTATNSTTLVGRTESDISNAVYAAALAFASNKLSSVTWTEHVEATLLCTNVTPWTFVSFGPYATTRSLGNIYIRADASGSCTVKVDRAVSNSTTYAEVMRGGGAQAGVYTAPGSNITLGVGDVGRLTLVNYDAAVSNIQINLGMTRTVNLW